VSCAADVSTNRRFLLLLIAGLLASQVAVYLSVGSLFCSVALVVAGLYIIRRSSEASWVGYFLLAVTSQTNPVQLDELGTAVRTAYRPYILVVVIVAVSMLIGQWLRPRRTYSRPPRQLINVWRRIGAVVAVLLLALAYGYFNSVREPGLVDILRECSGWITFLVFLLLGYRLSPSATETQRSSARFRLAVLVYSAFFIIKFVYLSFSLGADETAAGFGYSQRDAMFFSGLVLVLLIAQALTSGTVSEWKGTWAAGLVLFLATLFSGSRSVVACELIVTVLFVLVWCPKARLRLGIVGMVMMLVVLFGQSLVLPSQGGLLGYVSNRFLIVSVDDGSLVGHASEMVAVADAVRENPLLGKGPLASYSYFDPTFGWKDSTYLDSGLGYLLMKTGLLGTSIFIWFAVGWLKMAQGLRRTFPAITVGSLACFVFYLVFLLFGPSFFEFEHAWLIGLVVGHTIMLASKFPLVKASQIPRTLDQPRGLGTARTAFR
jgi:O-antigen ligase/polysaccharide polymerase Wzy-like membrane protein